MATTVLVKSPSTDTAVMSTSESPVDYNTHLQGPHDWRKRLKPVSRQSSPEAPSIPNCGTEGVECNGDSPPDKVTDNRHSSREEKLEDSKFKERIRGMPTWKKDLVTRRIKGVGSMIAPGGHRRRVMHLPTESAFTRQVVNKPTSPGLSRRKPCSATAATSAATAGQPSAHHQPRLNYSAWEKKSSVHSLVAGGRRQATNKEPQDTSAEASKRRVEKVLKARLYLLQQNGPNSFLIGGDSPDHKYRVIIGPQRCSCGRGPYCVHVMFVMLRVFQINENEPCLWSKTLKNYEVETLFKRFHERRSSLIQKLSRRKKKVLKEDTEEKSKSIEGSDSATTSTDNDDEAEAKDEHEEEDTCPICLLEMVEGESLTECVAGCQNKLHHHCIAVWFEECRRQNEPLICPLCRATWKVDPENSEVGSDLAAPPNTRVSSPTHEPRPLAGAEADVMLPHAEPVPPEHQATAEPWIPVLGEEVVSCLFSKNWMVREIAVKQLGRLAVGALLLGVGEGRAGVVVSADRQATTRHMLETCCSVIAYVFADPVYKVFVAALRTLRTVLAYTPCRDSSQQARLHTLMKPVVDGILWKCADSNKRTSQLSLSAMQELLLGQQGELSVGREIVNPGELGLGGLPYLLECVAQDFDTTSVQYQWLLGRLSFVHKVLEEQPSEFLLKVPHGDFPGKEWPLEEYENYARVMKVLRFTRGALENSHQKVARLARHVFYQIARLQSHNAEALKHVTDLLDTLGLNIQVQLKRKLLAKLTTEFDFTQRASRWAEAEIPNDAALGSSDEALPNTPLGSAPDSPLSGSPSGAGSSSAGVGTAGSTPPRISVTVNNFVSGNLNFVPKVPPNSPERRRGPEGRSRSGTETDSPASGGTSVVGFDGGVDCVDGLPSRQAGVPACASTPQKAAQSADIETLSSSPPPSLTREQAVPCTPTTMTKVDASVSTSPTLALRGIKFNLPSNGMGESSTDDLDIGMMTLDGKELGLVGVNCSAGENHQREQLATPMSCDEEEEEEEEDRCTGVTPELSSLDGELEAVHNTTMESGGQGSGSQHYLGGDAASSSVSSTDATAASGSSTGILSEDLSDPTVSPSGGEYHVSFKTEVTSNSPQQSSSRRAPIVFQGVPAAKEPCPCKEEVEREEAQALAAAMEQSELTQNPLPFVPGLSQQSASASIILVQDEAQLPNGERVVLDPMQTSTSSSASAAAADCDQSTSGEYREGKHWKRGPMLGTGAFSTCYQARDNRTGTLMAVKQISFCRNSVSEQEEVVETVRQEIQMMSRLNHPNIVRILGATQQACHFFMFVEWMPGGSVAYLLDRYGAFCENVIIKYTQQILRGLAYLHESHVLHRDLKGANLLVDSTGERVRIGDFGASARLASRQTAAGEFQGQLLGTIAFMAPEVLRGESYGRSCDVWSVGCTLIEMATTKPPWGAHDLSNHLALIFKIASAVNSPPVPESLSPPVRDLTLRCLECRREDRPPAKELLKHPLFTLLQKT